MQIINPPPCPNTQKFAGKSDITRLERASNGVTISEEVV